MSGDTSDVEQLLRDFVAWENGDASKRGVVAETVDVYNPGLPGGEVHSRADWEAYNEKIRAAFPDYTVELLDLVVADDLGMFEVRLTGTHEAEFQGLPPTGREIEVFAMSKNRVVDGQVVEVHQYYDTAQLQEQLGLSFPTVIGQLPRLAWGKLRSLR